MKIDNRQLIDAIDCHLAGFPLPHGVVVDVWTLKHLAPTARFGGPNGAEFCPWPHVGPEHVSFYAPLRRVSCVNTPAAIRALRAKLQRVQGLTMGAARKALLLPGEPILKGPAPIRPTSAALNAMLAAHDIDGIREAHAAGWPGVWLALINPNKASEGYLVGAPLPAPWADCAKARAVLVGLTGGVTWEPVEVHHIPTGCRLCDAKQDLGGDYRARVEEALAARNFSIINP